MPSLCRSRAVLLIALAAVAVLFSAAALTALPAGSQPTTTTAAADAESDIVTATVGPARVSLDTSASTIPLDGTFRFAASVSSTATLGYLQARMRLFMPSGRLIYQKTFVKPLSKRGSASFAFERSIADIGLNEGVYPAELSVRVSASGAVTETVVPTALLVYDEKREPLHVALVARVSAQPLSDADGKFVSDPAQFTRARDDAAEIARWVLDDPSAHVGLCLSPMMLEEWKRIASGYDYAGAEGEASVGSNDSVPRTYASALDALTRAQATGRLEVLALGYSDPDLSELGAAGLLGDVQRQYRDGRSRTSDALGANPSVGSAPAGSALSEAAASRLARAGVHYVVLDRRFVAAKGKPARAGAYKTVVPQLTALAFDARIARSLTASSSAELRPLVFDRYAQQAAVRTLPLLVEVGPGSTTAEGFVGAAKRVAQQPWSALVLPRDAANTLAAATARLKPRAPDRRAPADYWKTVKSAREWADALAWSRGDSPEAAQAQQSSLVAESSTWSGFNGQWTLAGRGLSYAASAKRTADRFFDGVTLTAKDVTLAGSSGRVPVTIVNKTEQPLRVVLTARPGPSVRLDESRSRVVELQPGENFVEVGVSLGNALQGDMALNLSAAGTRFASDSVTLRASYLDRLAIIGGLVVVLGGLLAYIIIRVRRAEAADRDE